MKNFLRSILPFTILMVVALGVMMGFQGWRDANAIQDPTQMALPYQSSTNPQIVNGVCEAELKFGKCIPEMGKTYRIGHHELFVLPSADGYQTAIYEQGSDNYAYNDLYYGTAHHISAYGYIQWEAEGIFIIINNVD